VENESSFRVFSGKSGGEFARKDENWVFSGKLDENWRYCTGVGAGGVEKTKYRGVGGVQDSWRGNGGEI